LQEAYLGQQYRTLEIITPRDLIETGIIGHIETGIRVKLYGTKVLVLTLSLKFRM